ncbi:MAG: carbon-nitrogen hydrolase family protein [Acidithiobacillus sp.]
MNTVSMLRIGVYQCSPGEPDVTKNINKMRNVVRIAKSNNLDILIFPEMYLTGYVLGSNLTHSLAEAYDGNSAQAISRIALENGLTIVYGYPESDGSGHCYNAVNCIGARGDILITYRKVNLFGNVDREQFSAGHHLSPLINIKGFAISFAICYDIEFPEVARALTLAGAELIIVPTANMTPYESVSERLVPARAQENTVYVAYANYIGHDSLFNYFGKSCICDPLGNDVSRLQNEEHLMYADLFKEAVVQARQTNHYLEDLNIIKE